MCKVSSLIDREHLDAVDGRGVAFQVSHDAFRCPTGWKDYSYDTIEGAVRSADKTSDQKR